MLFFNFVKTAASDERKTTVAIVANCDEKSYV